MRVLLLCLSCLLAYAAAGDFQELFKTDPKPLLEDKAKWNELFECLMDRGPCDEYQNVKDTLPKLLTNKCENCSPEEKKIFNETIQKFLEQYPDDYVQLDKKLIPGLPE